MNIDQNEIESWAIEAIANKVIDAKIDQLKEEIVIKNHMSKEIKDKEWESIRGKVTQWREKFERIDQVLNAQ